MSGGMGFYYWSGLLIVGAALVIEQSLVSPTDLSRLGAAFFTVNGFVSLFFLTAVGLDIFLR
jgi:4-hydroxybenzoate polyprenyltransferase